VTVHAERTAYGLLQVVHHTGRKTRMLLHDLTCHGVQSVEPGREEEPLAYYARSGPLGDVFAGWSPPEAGGGHVAVIGLGVGAIAAYARPGQRFTFFEVDPAVAAVARDTRFFTHLARCRGACEVVVADGVEGVGGLADGALDVLVVDAFVDDRVPAHLVGGDALALYLRKLAARGFVVLHVGWSDDCTALAGLARAAGLCCGTRADDRVTEEQAAAGKMRARYAVLARLPGDVAWLASDPRWTWT
jgi:hypothetical protein